jgi:hypothetical protein
LLIAEVPRLKFCERNTSEQRALPVAAQLSHFGCEVEPGIGHSEKPLALLTLCRLVCNLEKIFRVLAVLLLRSAVVFFLSGHSVPHSWQPRNALTAHRFRAVRFAMLAKKGSAEAEPV